MAHTETRTDNRPANRRLLGVALKSITIMVSALTAWRRTVAGRRAIADLTPDQLKDIGYREAPRPTLNIKAGLITNLMSMR
jgi:uncharacterized protein YjiS (DUF1127 family)